MLSSTGELHPCLVMKIEADFDASFIESVDWLLLIALASPLVVETLVSTPLDPSDEDSICRIFVKACQNFMFASDAFTSFAFSISFPNFYLFTRSFSIRLKSGVSLT